MIADYVINSPAMFSDLNEIIAYYLSITYLITFWPRTAFPNITLNLYKQDGLGSTYPTSLHIDPWFASYPLPFHITTLLFPLPARLSLYPQPQLTIPTPFHNIHWKLMSESFSYDYQWNVLTCFNPIAHRMAKTSLSFGHSECNRVELLRNLKFLFVWTFYLHFQISFQDTTIFTLEGDSWMKEVALFGRFPCVEKKSISCGSKEAPRGVYIHKSCVYFRLIPNPVTMVCMVVLWQSLMEICPIPYLPEPLRTFTQKNHHLGMTLVLLIGMNPCLSVSVCLYSICNKKPLGFCFA